MPRIPGFIESLDRIKKLHETKNEDYATSSDPFFNFNFTEYVMSHFKDERDKTFVWPIATKLARLANLLGSSSKPNHESVDDSLLDVATYILLWKADIDRRRTRHAPRTGSTENS
jgi:hypothetical protein